MIDKLTSLLPGFDIVSIERVAGDTYVVLLGSSKGYSVCRAFIKRKVVAIPSFSKVGSPFLVAPMDHHELDTILTWMDRETALKHFIALVGKRSVACSAEDNRSVLQLRCA